MQFSFNCTVQLYSYIFFYFSRTRGTCIFLHRVQKTPTRVFPWQPLILRLYPPIHFYLQVFLRVSFISIFSLFLHRWTPTRGGRNDRQAGKNFTMKYPIKNSREMCTRDRRNFSRNVFTKIMFYRKRQGETPQQFVFKTNAARGE